MRKSLSLLAEILKREWESALPWLGMGGGEQERETTSLLWPLPPSPHQLGRMLQVIQRGSAFQVHVTAGGSRNKGVPGKPLAPSYNQNCFVAGWLQTQIFICHIRCQKNTANQQKQVWKYLLQELEVRAKDELSALGRVWNTQELDS